MKNAAGLIIGSIIMILIGIALGIYIFLNMDKNFALAAILLFFAIFMLIFGINILVKGLLSKVK